jgi:hypothetical protein
MARNGGRAATARPQKLLYHPVFKAVKRHNRKPTTGLEHTLSCRQPALKFIKLAVDVDADRLKRPRCGVLFVMRLVTAGPPHDTRKIASARERARSNNRASDAT